MKKAVISTKPYCLVFFFSTLLIIGCKKDSDNQPEPSTKPSVLTIIENTNMANKKDTLIAVLDYAKYGIKYNFFGDYNNLGQPDKIKQVVITRGDTALNYTLDDNLRVRRFYCSLNSVKDTVLIEYDYAGTNIILNRYYMDWANNLAVLRKQAVVNNIGDTAFPFISSVNFRVNRSQGILDFVTAEGGIVVANAVIVTATTVGGFLLGGAIVLGGATLAVPGAIVGGILGIALATKPVKAAEIKTSQTAAPTSPPPPSQKYLYSIKIDSKTNWFNTGIQIKSGSSSTIQQVSGGWSVDKNNYPNVTADGHTNEGNTPLAGLSSLKTLQSTYFGALLGKVGNNIFKIGANFNGTLPYDGTLYLQINDESRVDNGGEITVRVTEN